MRRRAHCSPRVVSTSAYALDAAAPCPRVAHCVLLVHARAAPWRGPLRCSHRVAAPRPRQSGEDPVLGSALLPRVVDGIQANVMAIVKHCE